MHAFFFLSFPFFFLPLCLFPSFFIYTLASLFLHTFFVILWQYAHFSPHKTSAGFLTAYFVAVSKWYINPVPGKTERFATVFWGSIEHFPKGYTRANSLEMLPCPWCRYSQRHDLFVIHVLKRQVLLWKHHLTLTLNACHHPPSQCTWDTWFHLLPCEGSAEVSQNAFKKSHIKGKQRKMRPVVSGVDDIYWWWMNMVREVAWTEQGGLAEQGVNQS